MDNKLASDRSCEKEPVPLETDNRQCVSNEAVCQEAAEKLAAQLLATYQPKLQETKQKLLELTTKQKGLIDEMREENRKLSEAQCAEAIQEMVLQQNKVIPSKAGRNKKEMTYINEKSSKLKKRALKLQQTKQKEAMQRKNQRERQLQREQELIAKPSTSAGKKS